MKSYEAKTITNFKNLELCTKYWAILFELYGLMAVDSVLSTHKYTIHNGSYLHRQTYILY